MPLAQTEVHIQVLNLLRDEWDTSNVSQEFKTAWIAPGWVEEDQPNPAITLTGVTEDTSPDAIVPDGSGLSSWIDGSIDVNVWVPYPDSNYDYDSAGKARQFRWDLVREVHRIIENNQRGENTTDLTRLETGDIQRDPTDEEGVFRCLVPVGFVYRSAPE